MQKHRIKELVIQEKDRLGTNRAVAVKCDVSEATISQVINEKWEEITDKLWRKIAANIGYSSAGWQIVETTNVKTLHGLFDLSKEQSLWIAIAEKAGNSKTKASEVYSAENFSNAVFHLECGEWNRKQFLEAFAKVLGLAIDKSATNEDILQNIISYFIQRADEKPLFILDEANKLYPDALRALIPMYNKLEDLLGFVMMGPDDLEREVLKNVKYQKKGYDEIYSRFGRKFVHLFGATRKDCQAVCNANGITDKTIIKQIWEECGPEQVMYDRQFVKMITDMRKLKRLVKRQWKLTGQSVAS